MQQARLLSLATAVPLHVLAQEDVEHAVRACFGSRMPQFDRLSRVFRNSGIARRHAVRPIEWYLTERGWSERTAAFRQSAAALFEDAVSKALDQAGLLPREVDTVVTVSSTGIATPTFEVDRLGAMGFCPNVSRVPVFGLGCAGGATGLSIAARLAEARPGSIVLLVVVELCTLAFRLDQLTKANIVASALFGDGAAAAILRAGAEGGVRIAQTGEYTWPDTLDIMGWNVDALGFGVVFSQDIPSFTEARLRPALRAVIESWNAPPGDISGYICHPGGSKVVAALESALDLSDGQLDAERAVLFDHGNMSAPTVLFVLDRVLRRGLPDPSLLMAMGPGFTASCVLLEQAA